MQRPHDPIDGLSEDGLPRAGATLIHLPVRARTLKAPDAARYLSISYGRLRLLRLFGTGPARADADTYWVEDLDTYMAGLYERAGISSLEQARHRAEARKPADGSGPPLTGAGMRALRHHAERSPIPSAAAFMQLATSRELFGHGIFFLLKAMALFGFIMLCLSSTPLLKTHFG
jgi:hypothetical protein